MMHNNWNKKNAGLKKEHTLHQGGKNLHGTIISKAGHRIMKSPNFKTSISTDTMLG